MLKRKHEKLKFYMGFDKFLYYIYKGIFKLLKIFTIVLFSQCFVTFSLSPTGSMTPAYLSGDMFVVNYGFSIRQFIPDWSQSKNITLKNIHSKLSKPLFKDQLRRGDIVGFKSKNTDYMLSKRIIAIGGDKIKMYKGIIYINDKPLNLTYKGEYFKHINGRDIKGYLFEEENNGKKYNVLYQERRQSTNPVNFIEEQIVPKGHLVLIGDNRHASWHFDGLFHFIPEDQVFGRIIGSLIHVSKRTLNPITLLKSVDWSRFLLFDQ